MKNNNNKKNLLEGALVGAALGAVATLLLAPESGKKLRKDIKQKSAEFYKMLAPKLKKLKTLSEEEYRAMAKNVAAQYVKAKKMSKSEAEALMKDAHNSWEELKKHL